MNSRSNNPILVILDETPQAAQTLRFTVENLMHKLGETINVVAVVPTASEIHDSTTRLKSFLRLVMEPYSASSAKLSLTVISSDRPALAISETAQNLLPRLIVIGPPCTVKPFNTFPGAHPDIAPLSPTSSSASLHQQTVFGNLYEALSFPRRLFLQSNAVEPHGRLGMGGGISFQVDHKLTAEIMETVPPSIPVVVARIPVLA
ncbi:hypothetical protein BC829DRAFT_380887 [Chytridium lagenaria]|nr:hypothetical protein BC829DRAFT_380887 [Chytridium lagenaria]